MNKKQKQQKPAIPWSPYRAWKVEMTQRSLDPKSGSVQLRHYLTGQVRRGNMTMEEALKIWWSSKFSGACRAPQACVDAAKKS